MASFLDDNFLLSNEVSRRLYREHAEAQPILDYHCHLSPKDLAENRRFANLFDIWLEGDHYKWRAMRANGIPEKLVTGDAGPYDKFLAWARTVPYTLRNPLYHWTHLELQRYFGIRDLLNEKTASAIWERANAALAGDLTVHGILRKFRVETVCTTDDPTDDLGFHRKIAQSGLATRVYPAFRPDKALAIGTPQFLTWLEKLRSASNMDVRTVRDLLDALRKRHDEFHALGCRLSDHGLDYCYVAQGPEPAIDQIFRKALEERQIPAEEREAWAGSLMLYFARLDAEKGWTKQLHLGARRNVNSAAMRTLGPDTGYDTVGDAPQVGRLCEYLDLLAREDALPKMIVYNLNPAETFSFATLIGCFQSGTKPGRLQYGSAWWFLDQKDGIMAQIHALSNAGLLSRFIGMVTDSRSFMSYPRHEYFRRILCDIIGQDVARGELPDDRALLGRLIEDVCYGNAKSYLELPVR